MSVFLSPINVLRRRGRRRRSSPTTSGTARGVVLHRPAGRGKA